MVPQGVLRRGLQQPGDLHGSLSTGPSVRLYSIVITALFTMAVITALYCHRAMREYQTWVLEDMTTIRELIEAKENDGHGSGSQD